MIPERRETIAPQAFGDDIMVLIKTPLFGATNTSQGLTQPTEQAAGGLFMHDYTDRKGCQFQYLGYWREIKYVWPELAEGLLSEYQLRKGLIPYEQGFVYLMGAEGTRYYKIGKSKQPDRSLLQIYPEMPFQTKLVKAWPSNFMTLAEGWMHRRFAKFRVNGDWFELPEVELDVILKSLSPECTQSIKYAYALSIDFGLQEKELERLNEELFYVFEETSCVGFGPNTFSASAYAIAWLEDLFDQIAADKATGGRLCQP